VSNGSAIDAKHLCLSLGTESNLESVYRVDSTQGTDLSLLSGYNTGVYLDF